MLPPPPRSTLFPYTTLFRSGRYACSHYAAGGSGNQRAPVRVYEPGVRQTRQDRKSTRLNSSHVRISYAVFCLKKKKKHKKKSIKQCSQNIILIRSCKIQRYI